MKKNYLMPFILLITTLFSSCCYKTFVDINSGQKRDMMKPHCNAKKITNDIAYDFKLEINGIQNKLDSLSANKSIKLERNVNLLREKLDKDQAFILKLIDKKYLSYYSNPFDKDIEKSYNDLIDELILKSQNLAKLRLDIERNVKPSKGDEEINTIIENFLRTYNFGWEDKNQV